MKFLGFSVISLAFTILLPPALGEVDRYEWGITEKGTAFSEQIDLDEKRNVEVFRVPAHNDVDAADFFHDFKMGVTVTKILARRVCYVAEMDPSLPSPRKLKADIKRAASRPGKLPVITEMNLVIVTGPANRLVLTKEILDFCGALPIYNTEVLNNPTIANGTAIIKRARQKRQTQFILTGDEDLPSCLSSVSEGRADPLKYVKEGNCLGHTHWDLYCKVKNLPRNCYYFVTCVNNKKTWPSLTTDYNCTAEHKGAQNAYCCDPKCQRKAV